jgi:general nucleoside transport system permease protein
MAAIDPGLFLASTLTLAGPLVLAAMGGLTSERSGVMNIALEGKLLAAACATALVSLATQNPWLGLMAGLLAATLVSLLHAVLTQAYGMDHIISGMALNALSLGGTSFVYKALVDRDVRTQAVYLPVQAYWALSAVAVAAIAWSLSRSRPGLRLLAVGEDPDKSRQMGVSVTRVRYGALIATGVLCGLGGALVASNAGSFTDGMTAGRGFIALAALIVGGWRPWPTLAACVGFGAFNALQITLQGTPIAGNAIPVEAWIALPYVVTLVALVGLLGRSRPPAGLGRP